MTLVPEFGGCTWPLDPACLQDDWEDYDPEVRERATAYASATLSRLTAYRVGNCPITVRPCRQSAYGSVMIPFTTGTGWTPGVNVFGSWVNTGMCGSGDCETDCEITLPGPIGRVDQIKVDGAIIAPAKYAVYGDKVVWVDSGACPFPARQDLSLPDTQPGTFSVTYLNAYPVDALGAHAAALLAIEFAKACSGNSCQLPSNVRSVARQGLVFDVITGAFPDGFTGIRQVDTFISLWNPKGRTQQAGVWYPGINRPRHQTG